MTAPKLDARLSLRIAASLSVVSCRLSEGLSERTHALVEVASVEHVDFGAALGDDALVEIVGADERRWSLKVGAAHYLGDAEGSYRYELELFDPAWRLTFRMDTRKFRNLSARDIVSQVLDELGVRYRWEITQTLPVRKYTAQYRETNLAFVERLLAYEGVYYGFDPDGVMVLGDESRAAPRVHGGELFELLEGASALEAGKVGIGELRIGLRTVPGRVTLADYNWKKPDLKLQESAVASRDSLLEIYHYPAGFRKPEQGARLARLRLEAERVRAQFAEGKSNVAAFAPGQGFAFGNVAGDAFAGEYLLVRVGHHYANEGFAAIRGAAKAEADERREARTYENSFSAIPLKTPFRPAASVSRPTVGGTHTAMVRGPAGEEIHTDQYGRFRAQMHWDRGAKGSDEDSRWLRILQESSTSMALARTGWEMHVAYIDGDPDRPIGIGRAINAVMTPSYAQPSNKNLMTIKTPSSPASGGYSEIKMDDTAESQLMAFRAEKDLEALVKNEKTETIGNNETHTVGTDFGRKILGNQTVTIGAKLTANIGKQYKLQVQGSRKKTVGASEKVDVGKAMTCAVGKSDGETVGSLRLTVAGSLKPPDIKAMLKSAAETFVRTASPGGAALYDKGTSLYQKGSSVLGALHGGSGSDGGGGGGKGAGAGGGGKGAGAGAGGGAGGGASGSAGGGASGGSAITSYLEGKGTGLGTEAANAFGKALGEGKGLDAAWDAATGKVTEAADGAKSQLEGLIPSGDKIGGALNGLEKSVNSIVPTSDTLSAAANGALSKATGGVSDALKAGDYHLALNKLIDMCALGGIKREVSTASLKVVGGAYITAAVQSIEWKAGAGYLETVGGIKLTCSADAIKQEVGSKLVTTVGGAVMRIGSLGIGINSGQSTITVGGAATLRGRTKLEIKGKTVKLKANTDFLLKEPKSQVDLKPGAANFKGKLNLEAPTVVITGATVDLTK